MKYSNALFLSLVIALGGCAPSPTSTTNSSIPGAEYKGNVSTLYSLGTSTTPPGIEFEWKDGSGNIQKLSDHLGRAIVVAFWRTNENLSQGQIAVLDSVAADLKDSVFMVGIANDRIAAGHSFGIVLDYVQSHTVKMQVVVDSQAIVQGQFVQLNDGKIYTPEIFILHPSGHLSSTYQGGPFPASEIDSAVRAAYP